MNGYTGCSYLGDNVDVISSGIDPKEFFDKYVDTRTPVKFSDIICDDGWKFPSSLDELQKIFVLGLQQQQQQSKIKTKSVDGVSDTVKVEERATNKDRFGEGSELRMKFIDFLDEMKRNNDRLYMTTQAITTSEGLEGCSCADDTKPAIISPPLTVLTDHFPMQPVLMGNLIPSNINLWVGCHRGDSGFSSSGMHHDYHDNLYILLKGTKQFTLVAPTHHQAMYTVGTLSNVHPNGRVNYEGEPTEADGSHSSSLKALLASQQLAAAVAAAAEGNADEDEEDDIDAALQAVLDAECGEDDDEDDEEGDIDFDGSEGEDSDRDDDVDEEEEEDEEDEEDGIGLPSNLSPAILKNIVAQDTSHSLRSNSKAYRKRKGTLDTAGAKKRSRGDDDDDTPPNFSRLGTNVIELAQRYRRSGSDGGETRAEFPLFKDLVCGDGGSGGSAKSKGKGKNETKTVAMSIPQVTVVTLRAGEMLYLPAGWFHEVRSCGAHDNNNDHNANSSGSNRKEGNNEEQEQEEEGKHVHMAFNYWFHPPDNVAGVGEVAAAVTDGKIVKKMKQTQRQQDSSSDRRFRRPYLSDFWPLDWKQRLLESQQQEQQQQEEQQEQGEGDRKGAERQRKKKGKKGSQ